MDFGDYNNVVKTSNPQFYFQKERAITFASQLLGLSKRLVIQYPGRANYHAKIHQTKSTYLNPKLHYSNSGGSGFHAELVQMLSDGKQTTDPAGCWFIVKDHC